MTLVRTMLRRSRCWPGPHRPLSSQARNNYSICGDVARSEYSVTRLLCVKLLIVVPPTLQGPGCGAPSACSELPMHMSHTTGRSRPRAHPRISKSDCRKSAGSASEMSSLTKGCGFSRTPASFQIGRCTRSNAGPRRRSKRRGGIRNNLRKDWHDLKAGHWRTPPGSGKRAEDVEVHVIKLRVFAHRWCAKGRASFGAALRADSAGHGLWSHHPTPEELRSLCVGL